MSKTASLRRRPLAPMLLMAAIVALACAPLLPLTARGCSCAMPSDIATWVGQSEAVLVGTLVDKHDAGQGQLGHESIYVFEVEEWVKGNAGDVVEVISASDGAGCGFEFWDEDQRIGTAVYMENGELHGGLCSQIDPDVLLAAVEGPVASTTGLPRLLTGNGWSSTRLSVLDAAGGHVGDFLPAGKPQEFAGTQSLEVCPEGDLMLQLTPIELVVWDLSTMHQLDVHELTLDGGWVSDVSCRNADASSIWLLIGTDSGSELVEVLPEPATLLDLAGTSGQIGTNYVISQSDGEGDTTWVDVATGEQMVLSEIGPNELRSMSVATHPTEARIALVETRFGDGVPVEATLTVIDGSGAEVERFEIPWETYSPVWLDGNRVAVKAYDFDNWENAFGFVFDLGTGEMTEIEGWDAEYTIADGDTLYGVHGGDILAADLATGTVETLVTLASQSAGPLVLLEEGTTVTTTTTMAGAVTEPTIPPLLAPDLGHESGATSTSAQWIGGVAVVAFLGILVWLAVRSPRQSSRS